MAAKKKGGANRNQVASKDPETLLYEWTSEASHFVWWTRIEAQRPRMPDGRRAMFPFAFHGLDFDLGAWLARWSDVTSAAMPRFPADHEQFGRMPECGNTFMIGTRLSELTWNVAELAESLNVDSTPALALTRELWIDGGIHRLLPRSRTRRCIEGAQLLTERLILRLEGRGGLHRSRKAALDSDVVDQRKQSQRETIEAVLAEHRSAPRSFSELYRWVRRHGDAMSEDTVQRRVLEMRAAGFEAKRLPPC